MFLAVASAVAVAAFPDMSLEVNATVPAVAGRVIVTSPVEAGPIRVTLFEPLSESSKNSMKPALVAPFLS